jgi:hypothetical protein
MPSTQQGARCNAARVAVTYYYWITGSRSHFTACVLPIYLPQVRPIPTPSHLRSVSPSDLDELSAPYSERHGASVRVLAISLTARQHVHRHDKFRANSRPVPNSFSLASLHRVVANRTSATSRHTRHTLVHKMLQQASPILNRISSITSIRTV